MRRNWRQVVSVLRAEGSTPAQLAAAASVAADGALSRASQSPGIWYPFLFLVQAAQSARSPEQFHEFITEAGLPETASGLEFIRAASTAVGDAVRARAPIDAFSELAQNAFRGVLIDALRAETTSLFESKEDDARRAVAGSSSAGAFGRIASAFITRFYADTLAYFLSFEISHHVGSKKRFENLNEASEFRDALRAYTSDVVPLVRTFAEQWYAKVLRENRAVEAADARQFLHVAFRKLRTQLERERH